MALDLRIAAAKPDVGPMFAEAMRDLTQADIAILSSTNRETKGSPLKRISERHHALARLLAAGTSQADACIVTGYDPSRVSILCDDPSFKELLDFYRRQVDAEYLGMHAQLAGLGADALAELRRRLEENPEDIGFASLLEVVTKVADRTGHGAQTKTEVNVTVGLADRMKAAREKARAASQIDLQAKDITPNE